MPAILRYRKNLSALTVDVDAREFANRIFPQGAATDGIHKTMAGAIWEVGAITGNIVTLLPDVIGDPIRFDDQLNGLFCRRYGTNAEWLVIDTGLANQTVTLDDNPDTLEVGDFVQFRVNRVCLGTSGELTYLDRPASIASYGLVEARIERPDIPPIDNLIKDPYIVEWDDSTGFPLRWGGVGAPFFVLNSQHMVGDDNSQYGGSAAWVQAVAAFEFGIQSEWVNVYPTFANPYFSAQAVVTVLYGSVRFEMELDLVGDGSSTIIVPDPTLPISEQGGPGVRNNFIRTQRKPILIGIGGINCFSTEQGMAKRIRIRIIRELDDDPPDAIFILDAGQLIQWPYNVETIYDFRGSNALWHSANDALDDGFEESRGVPQQRISVKPIDLYRRDPSVWAQDRVEYGQIVKVQHPPFGIDEDQRVVNVDRNLARLGARDSEFELSNRIVNQSHKLTSRLRPRTIIVPQLSEGIAETGSDGGGLDEVTVVLLIDPDGDGKDYEYFYWTYNSVIQTATAGRFTADITSTIDGSIATGIDPTDVATNSPTGLGQGSIRVEVFVGDPTDTWRRNVYTIALFDTGTLAQLHQASRGDYYA
jgi:hypothetical protein